MAVHTGPLHMPGGQHCINWEGCFVTWVFWKEGDDLATREVGNLPYTVGFKVCVYTVPPEYGEYGGTRRVPLANVLTRDGIRNVNATQPFWRGTSSVKNRR